MVLSSSDDESDVQNLRAISDAAVRGAASTRGSNDPEDAAQDALEEMIASGTSYDNPQAFAFRAAQRKGIDHGRRAAARKRAAERARSAGAYEPVPSPEEIVVARLYAKGLMELAQSTLTPAQFDGFVSLYFDGGSVSDAAEMLASRTGRSAETIRTHIRRAVEKMRRAGGQQ